MNRTSSMDARVEKRRENQDQKKRTLLCPPPAASAAAAAARSPAMVVLAAVMVLIGVLAAPAAEASWCIAQSGANPSALQAALDYACGPGGGDCVPIQPSGLCYLPNTLTAHASYAFNSVFQLSGDAPTACAFSGTAVISVTDPSYGSCTYPSSPSTAGGSTSPTTPNPSTPPNSPTAGTTLLPPPPPPPPGFGGNGTSIGGTVGGGLTPGFSPPVPNYDTSSCADADSALLPVILSCCFYFLPLLF